MKFPQNKRPCECGCRYEDHVKIEFTDGKPTQLYCRECPIDDIRWCYNYRPVGNLEYLEWLTR